MKGALVYSVRMTSLTLVLYLVLSVLFSHRSPSFANPVFLCHPLLMGIAWALLAPVTATVQKVSSGEAATSFHIKMSVAVVALTIAGLVCIIVHKIRRGYSLVPSSPHAWLGVSTVLAMCIQAVSGFVKAKTLSTDGTRVLRWHGILGVFLVLLSMASIYSGAVAVFGMSGITVPLLILLTIVGVSVISINLTFGRDGATAVDETEELLAERE